MSHREKTEHVPYGEEERDDAIEVEWGKLDMLMGAECWQSRRNLGRDATVYA